MAWNPTHTLKFAGPRLQPGLDLITRLPDIEARRIVDLGCGSGALAAQLAERWPRATVAGLDRDRNALREARATHPDLEWVEADIADWAPKEPVDLIFSNAALQWLEGHEALVPRLLSFLAPGGVLAVQMPRNFDAPSHVLMRALASEPPWSGRIPLRRPPVGTPAAYYDLLAPRTAALDIWETEYLHVLKGDNPVLHWVRGTALLPVMAALSGPELDAFIATYAARLAQAYPPQPDGSTLFPFRRLLLLARVGA
jgi:trans-aconitate 2-methyltransferase